MSWSHQLQCWRVNNKFLEDYGDVSISMQHMSFSVSLYFSYSFCISFSIYLLSTKIRYHVLFWRWIKELDLYQAQVEPYLDIYIYFAMSVTARKAEFHDAQQEFHITSIKAFLFRCHITVLSLLLVLLHSY